jgi:hypothetical protein
MIHCELPAGHEGTCGIPLVLKPQEPPKKRNRTKPAPVPAAEQLAPLPKALCATCGGRDGEHKPGCGSTVPVDARDVKKLAAGDGS